MLNLHRIQSYLLRFNPTKMPDNAPVKIVIHHAPDDAVYFSVLNKHLSFLEKQGQISLWHTGKLLPGTNQIQETISQIQSAQILLLLISVDYLNFNDFGTLSPLFVQLPKESVIPVIVGPCIWEDSPELVKFTPLPFDNEPISFKTEKAIFEEVIQVLAARIDKIAGKTIQPDAKTFLLPKTLPTDQVEATNHKLLPLKYTCNRSTQKGEFLKNTLMSRNQKVQYFYIRGIVRQSTEGLFRRFYHQEIPKFYKNKNISPHFVYVPVVPDNDLDVFILNFLDELSMQLKCTNDDIYTEQNITALLNAICVKSYEVVCVGFKMKSEVWNEQVPSFIRWFISKFCQSTQPDLPQFLFFFMIDYAENEHKLKIEIELKQLQEQLKAAQTDVTLLSPLQQVSLVDIEVWLDSNLQDPDKQATLVQQYFNQQDQYDMYDVERNLEQIIKQYNLDIQKAIDN